MNEKLSKPSYSCSVPGAKSYYDYSDLNERRVGANCSSAAAGGVIAADSGASAQRTNVGFAQPSSRQPAAAGGANRPSALLNTSRLDPSTFPAAGGKPPIKSSGSTFYHDQWSLKNDESVEGSTVYRRVYTPKEIDPRRGIVEPPTTSSAPTLPHLYVPRAKQSTAKDLIFGGANADQRFVSETQRVFVEKPLGAADGSGRGGSAVKGKDTRSSWKLSDGGGTAGNPYDTAYGNQFTQTVELKESARMQPRCGQANTSRAGYHIVHGGPPLTNRKFEAWETGSDYRRVVNFL